MPVPSHPVLLWSVSPLSTLTLILNKLSLSGSFSLLPVSIQNLLACQKYFLLFPSSPTSWCLPSCQLTDFTGSNSTEEKTLSLNGFSQHWRMEQCFLLPGEEGNWLCVVIDSFHQASCAVIGLALLLFLFNFLHLPLNCNCSNATKKKCGKNKKQ